MSRAPGLNRNLNFAGSSKSQITRVIGILRIIFSAACAEGIILRDPTVALVRPKAMIKNERRPLTPDETQRILHVAKNHSGSLLLAVLYYTGVRRGDALGLKWGDFDFTEDQVHIQRDICFTGPTAQEGALKTDAADRYIPIPPELKELLFKQKVGAGEYVFHTANGKPLSQATFKRIWCRLMLAADCVEWREKKLNTSRENDILKCIKPIITPHYFRHNYITLLYTALEVYTRFGIVSQAPPFRPKAPSPLPSRIWITAVFCAGACQRSRRNGRFCPSPPTSSSSIIS